MNFITYAYARARLFGLIYHFLDVSSCFRPLASGARRARSAAPFHLFFSLPKEKGGAKRKSSAYRAVRENYDAFIPEKELGALPLRQLFLSA